MSLNIICKPMTLIKHLASQVKVRPEDSLLVTCVHETLQLCCIRSDNGILFQRFQYYLTVLFYGLKPMITKQPIYWLTPDLTCHEVVTIGCAQAFYNKGFLRDVNYIIHSALTEHIKNLYEVKIWKTMQVLHAQY